MASACMNQMLYLSRKETAHSRPEACRSRIRGMRATPSDTPAVWVPYAAAIAILISAPFELLRPFLSFPGQELSNLEAVVFGALSAWIGWAFLVRRPIQLKTGLTTPVLGLVAVMLVSALISPEHTTQSLRFIGRFLVGFCVLRVPTRRQRRQQPSPPQRSPDHCGFGRHLCQRSRSSRVPTGGMGRGGASSFSTQRFVGGRRTPNHVDPTLSDGHFYVFGSDVWADLCALTTSRS